MIKYNCKEYNNRTMDRLGTMVDSLDLQLY